MQPVLMNAIRSAAEDATSTGDPIRSADARNRAHLVVAIQGPGNCGRPPGIGLAERHPNGGNSPQSLVNSASQRILRGELDRTCRRRNMRWLMRARKHG